MPETKRPLKVFLCHASADKPKVRELYRYLRRRGIKPWFDEVDLIGGQDWQVEIPRAIATSDAIIICLTKNSIDKEGYVQKEIKFALDKALEMPEGRIYLIPVRFEECEVPFSLSRYQWVDLFDEIGFTRLMRSLKTRAGQLERANVQIPKPDDSSPDFSSHTEEKAALENAEHEAADKAELEAAEKAARDKTEKDVLEKARLEAEEQARQKAVEEKAEREAAEKVKREKAEHQATQIVALKEMLSKFFAALKSDSSKIMRFIRTAGIIGFIIALFWSSSWIILKFISLIPTVEANVTSPANTKIVASKTPVPPTKTIRPNATPTKTRTPAPTALPTEITDAKGASMVLVPAGKFIMGSDSDAYYLDIDQKPAHNVFLDAFYIDKYEVTNSLYKACEDAGVCTGPYRKSSYNLSSIYGSPESDNYPVIYVDWYQAKAYCEWRDARLPTEAEWEKAAQGTDTGRSNSTWTTNYNGDTAKVGSYPASKSMYGAYDMAGNVWEWVNDWYQSDYYSTLGDNAANPQGPDTGNSKVLRGGSWLPGGDKKGVFNESVGPVYNRYRDFPLRYYFDTGFRCAKSVNP